MRNKKTGKTVIALVLFLLLWASGATAQNVNWIANSILDLYKNAPWKLGPLHLYRAFYLNNAGYDSDIYFGYLEKTYPDFTLFAGPAFQVLVPLKKTIFFDSYQSLQGAFYLKNDRERAFNFRSNNQVHFLAKKLYGRTGLNYSNLRDRFSPEMPRIVRHEELSWNGFLMFHLSRSFSVAWQAEATSFDYPTVEVGNSYIDQTLNRFQYYFDFFLFYRSNPKWQYYLNLQSGLYKFKKPEAKFKDTRQWAAYLGLEFIPLTAPERRKFTGNINVGFKYLQPEDARLKSKKALVGSGLMAVNLSRLLTWQIYYNRDYSVSVYSDLLYYLQTSFGLGLNFNLNSKMTLTNQLMEGISSYPFRTEGVSSFNRFKFFMFSSSLSIKASRDLSLNLMMDLGTRIIYPSGIKNSRQFIGFGLTYGSVPGVRMKPDFSWY